MYADDLFHPHHVVPSSEFIAAFVEFSNHLISQMAVKLNAVFRQVLIILIWITDAGIQIQDILRLRNCLQSLVKPPPHARFPFIFLHINRHLCRPVIGGPSYEWAGIRVSQDLPVLFRHKVRIFFQSIFNPAPEFRYRRHIPFKRDRRLFHIRCIYAKQFLGIGYRCLPDL